MPFLCASRAADVILLLVACSPFLAEIRSAAAAVPYLDDEKEFIIGELANIIKDQNRRMRENLRDDDDDGGGGVVDYQPMPRNRVTDDNQAFTYDLASDLPDLNTGDQQIPFAVLPNDDRYYQPDFSNNLAVPQSDQTVTSKYHKKERAKSSEVLNNVSYNSDGYVASKVTTENSSSSEVMMDLPQATYMHMPFSTHTKFNQDDYYFFAKAAGFGLAVLVVLIISTIACYRMKKNNKAAADIDYPAYGITGPNKDISPTGDRRLAQSAQMYHYQHQKQQIIAMESNSSVKENRCGSVSDPDSDDDNEEGDYTVYECPGLAPAGEMEVKNPLFLDDNTPASPKNPSKDDVTQNGVIPTKPVP